MNFLISILSLLGATVGLMALRDNADTSRDSRGDEDTSDGGREDPAAPPPEVVDPDPEAPEQSGDGGSGGGGDSTVADSDGAIEVMAGRVTTFEAPGDDVMSVRILEGTTNGTVTVNPDNTIALVLTQSQATGGESFSYETTHADGSVQVHDVNLNVIPGAQDGGWGTGESHYMLETGEDGRLIVEHGDDHTKVYVSGSADALSLADIAQIEGLDVSQITGSWLADHGGYGQSEDLALDQTAGMSLWNTVTPWHATNSNWLLLESGYQYDELGRIFNPGSDGESELHPLYVGAFGEGEKPEITEKVWAPDGMDNVVIQGVHFSDGILLLNQKNWIFDDVTATGDELVFQLSEGITFRNSSVYDVITPEPETTGDGTWFAHTSRVQGLFAHDIDGFLLEKNLFDHNGWEDDYTGSVDDGQPPSMYSHNMYITHIMDDVTVRDTITMQASSFGLVLRAGGYVENNLFLDNNAAVDIYGGQYNGEGAIGNYSLLADNVITSGAHKDATQIGALTMGIMDQAEMTSMVDNIVAHLADPNNPDELAEKDWTHPSVYHKYDPHYDDTIVWNWQGNAPNWAEEITEQNVDDLDTGVLDMTTIQLFTAQLLGDPDATIGDLATYLRAQAEGALDNIVDADLIIQFFQTGFGIAPDVRATEATLRFVPNSLGDGVRWDNSLNWDTDDLPGTQDGDSVDLGGNHVVFGSTATIDTLDFGDAGVGGGALNVYGGKLEATGGMTGNGGHLNVEGAGQAWINGADGSEIDVTVSGGRFVNTGDISNVDLTASGGQTVLATDGAEFDVSDGHTLAIEGSDARVGFDGTSDGIAILDLQDTATLAYTADANGLGTIEEFRTGAMGDAPNVQSGIDLGGASLTIDLSGLSPETVTDMMLMSSDELVGLIDEAMIEGLGARDATIMIDYQTDSVTLHLSEGSGQVSIETTGDESDVTAGSEDLWAALTADHGFVSESAAMVLPGDEENLNQDVIETIF